MSDDNSFVPEDLAGQIVYLIDNQDEYLVKNVARICNEELTITLHSGEVYRITIEKV